MWTSRRSPITDQTEALLSDAGGYPQGGAFLAAHEVGRLQPHFAEEPPADLPDRMSP